MSVGSVDCDPLPKENEQKADKLVVASATLVARFLILAVLFCI